MQTDEQLIADLTASLRQATEYLDALKLILTDNGSGTAPRLFRSGTHEQITFDWDTAREILQAASARLATIQPRLPGLALRISITHAEQLSEGMSDLLCWCAGFSAACTEPDRHPYGVDDVRTMRMELRDAIARARGQQDEEWSF